jgi:hypothetical protein
MHMTRFRRSLTCVLLAALTSSAPAGILFNRQPKPKPRPEERVPELIATVRTDPDENKRSAAAVELRQYDPKAFPDIVPVLAEVVRNDTKAGVRYEAAVSLSKIRPVSTIAGMALEHASAHDAAFYVRVQARTSLVYYRLSGYRSPRPKEREAVKRNPPSQLESVTSRDMRLTPLPNGSSTTIKTTAQMPPSAVTPDNTVARPLPQGPAQSPLVPAEPPKLETPPSSAKDEDGPALVPPRY